ncbi:vacuolar protein sorting-associated protein 62 [Diaporthe helianthi]|uniref:Vacuolar protein sorting-associated protein 62 n=1 Tax=Diaporthe helianthi TaxID=158607 RepID=A0A2P5HS55_DIAHE|nr:vacuolar protein sorting-associated protein 62 [Diaporthe helianthi]
MALEIDNVGSAVTCKSAAGIPVDHLRRGPMSSSRRTPSPLLPSLLCSILLSNAQPSTCASVHQEGEAAVTLTTVPDFVTRHAPLVWLHSDDPFRPSDLLQHVRHTTPMVNGTPVDGLPELDLDSLALLDDRGFGRFPVALTTDPDDVTELPAWILGETPDESGALHNTTACVVIVVESEGDASDVAAFYFYFYSYNRGVNTTRVLEPIRSMVEKDTDPAMYFGDHVGDWEHNMVRFRDGNPTGIYFSQHSDGAAYKWNDPALSKEDERPLVYSAWGSHANYISPGTHVHDVVIQDYCNAGQRWDPVSSAYFYRFDALTSKLARIFPPGAPQASNFTSAIYFPGLWGDTQYPDSDPRQMTVPRFGLKRYVSGPTGPMSKQLVRKALFPDHRAPKSWLQWGVGIFMALYPCCLRGWRVWVSGTLLIVVLVSITISIIVAARRYRSKKMGYEKVSAGADIPLNDLRYRDDAAMNGRHSEDDDDKLS